MLIKIYEFSTGIKVSRDPELGWVSNGYTTNKPYGFNSFASEPAIDIDIKEKTGIPEVIHLAVRNEYFEIKPSDNGYAVTGRYLDNQWAVLAVADSLLDEARRTVYVYRYFCCQDSNQNIDPILTLIDWYIGQGCPRFDPDTNNQRSVKYASPRDYVQLELNENERMVLNYLRQEAPDHSSQTSLILLEEIRNIISNLSITERRDFSWALGVTDFEAIVNSGKFYLVQSAQDHLLVIKKKTEFVNQKQRVIDTNSLKYSLNDLASDSPSNIKRLIDRLFSEDVEQQVWESIFDNMSLPRLVDRPFPSPTSIRLLTIQAILVPKTITKLIEKSGDQENKKIVQEFENKLLQEIVIDSKQLQNTNNLHGINKLLEKLYEGIWFCLNNPQHSQYYNALKKLTKNKGLWNFVLRSWVTIDFYSYFNNLSLTSQTRDFFNLLNNSTYGINTRNIYKYLRVLWYDTDPVITAFCYQRLFESIPIQLYYQIEKTKYWNESSKQNKYVWTNYIQMLNLNQPQIRRWQKLVQDFQNLFERNS